MRWQLADEERDGQPALFGVDELVGPQRGTGSLSHLEFPARDGQTHSEPGSGPVPRCRFAGTINVYRGCSHACTYCLTGDTRILMVDGSSKLLRTIQVGDRVYGTQCDSNGRRYVPTTVQAHWQTIKPAYRVELVDGTALTASADHRFLTDAGWAYVSGRRAGRRYLAPGQQLHGVWERKVAIRSIAPLGTTLPMYDITTGNRRTSSPNGVISHNCFARPTHDYLGLGIGEDFDRKIVVKVNAVERVRAELAPPRLDGRGGSPWVPTPTRNQRCEGKLQADPRGGRSARRPRATRSRS